jgi:Fe-S-cluster containining protein
MSKVITKCIRCGTCCKKGGPSFHLEDKMLIEKGIILSKYLSPPPPEPKWT